ASAWPVTTRSDSFGSKPGQSGAVSLLGVLGPPVQPTPKSRWRRSAASALIWSACEIRTVGSSASAADAAARTTTTLARRDFAAGTRRVVARKSLADPNESL